MSATCGKNLLLGHRQLLAGGNANLPFHEIDAGDHFGDRVLHLQTGVHLQEEELAILINELDGSCVVVTDSLCCFDSGFTHCVFNAVGKCGRRSFFDQFLVTTLCRAVARGDPHHVAVLVSHQLHFNMARPGEVALDIDFVATKEVLGFTLC